VKPAPGRRRGAVVLAAAAVLAAGGEIAGGELYPVVEGTRIVYTNSPGRSDSRGARAAGATSGASRPTLPPTRYDRHIEEVAREEGLSPNLIKAVALVESGLDPRAVSPKGAQGLMQLMPETARLYGVADVFDPQENLRAGARHLRSLLEEFDGDLALALAAYNAGSGAVRRHGGIPTYPETRAYVRRVHERLAGESEPGPAPQPAADVRLVRGADGSLSLVN
jgi:hypothetical protein